MLLRRSLFYRGDVPTSTITRVLRSKDLYQRKTKQQRQEWFYSLTEQDREEWIRKKQAEKSLKRAGKPSNCTVFPLIDSSNRKKWQERVLKLNNWLDPDVFEPAGLNRSDQRHLESITQEVRSA